MLYPVIPRVTGGVVRRALFVSETLHAALNSPPGADPDWEARIGSLRADLEVFVESRTVDPKYLFLLSPARDAVWEIRSVRDRPSIRVLGLFAERDVFIATHHAVRSELGGWQSDGWKAAKREASAVWRRLFHTYPPVRATDIKDVVTGALDGRYFK